jgi:LemA protein
LVATVKQYASHEQETLTKLAALRSQAAGVRTGSDEAVGLNNQLSQALGRIMVVAESYPALKANENFQQLQRSLNEVEEQLSAARRAFNAAVTSYNDGVEMFPTNVVARLIGLRRRQVFEVPETERARPDVATLFKA